MASESTLQSHQSLFLAELQVRGLFSVQGSEVTLLWVDVCFKPESIDDVAPVDDDLGDELAWLQVDGSAEHVLGQVTADVVTNASVALVHELKAEDELVAEVDVNAADGWRVAH